MDEVYVSELPSDTLELTVPLLGGKWKKYDIHKVQETWWMAQRI